jgi:hypothetical protein
MLPVVPGVPVAKGRGEIAATEERLGVAVHAPGSDGIHNDAREGARPPPVALRQRSGSSYRGACEITLPLASVRWGTLPSLVGIHDVVVGAFFAVLTP